MEELESTGKCLFCEKTFSKAGITRHLSTHLLQKSKTGKPGLSFHIKAETNPRWSSGHHFLNLWVDGEAFMEDIDDFLRHIWLECCGHMSGFTNTKKTNRNRGFNLFAAMELLEKGDKKAYEEMMEESSNEIPMSRKTGKALSKDMKLKYDYDYGSTTSLQLTVSGEYPVKADEPIVLLSRNEPLKLLCKSCHKKPATLLCTACSYHSEEWLFCDACAKKHSKKCGEFDEYSSLPVVNSPRMGVCGYTGGSIDKERDGIFAG